MMFPILQSILPAKRKVIAEIPEAVAGMKKLQLFGHHVYYGNPFERSATKEQFSGNDKESLPWQFVLSDG